MFVIGAGLPGMPYIVSGRGKYLSWGPSTLYSDSSDLWEEKIYEREG